MLYCIQDKQGEQPKQNPLRGRFQWADKHLPAVRSAMIYKNCKGCVSNGAVNLRPTSQTALFY
jgi:hypothetical protein